MVNVQRKKEKNWGGGYFSLEPALVQKIHPELFAFVYLFVSL